MAQRERDGKELKQMQLRLDPELYDELCRRSRAERKSMSDIVREVLRSHPGAVGVAKVHLRAVIDRIARKDTDMLKTLGRDH